jgi:hypothetical protein
MTTASEPRDPSEPEQPEEWQRFHSLARRLLRVPSGEVKALQAQEREAKKSRAVKLEPDVG